MDEGLAFLNREENNFGPQPIKFHLGYSLYSIQNRHRDVDDQNVRIQGLSGTDERLTIANSPHYVIVLREHFSNAFEHGFVVIGKQNMNSAHWDLISVMEKRVIRLSVLTVLLVRAEGYCQKWQPDR